ncbi:uncharacterized protein [Triticum aestivum]|uniref:uncharacterized protein n=1 Tax=Triticum aestivum TaxID=4565 RepID=UPI001D0253BE|nr:uncharacterized protein LOC123161936 [Triticum aestivum]
MKEPAATLSGKESTKPLRSGLIDSLPVTPKTLNILSKELPVCGKLAVSCIIISSRPSVYTSMVSFTTQWKHSRLLQIMGACWIRLYMSSEPRCPVTLRAIKIKDREVW